MQRVTIQDIADALGVSRNTVSKAINNSDGLADATRERILQKAVEMGYKQFSYVAALAGNAEPLFASVDADPEPAGEIALFTSSIFNQSNHFAASMMDRFQREVSQLGYILSIHLVDRDNLTRRTLPATFNKERCSGILCVEMFDWAYDEMVCGLGLPVLFVDGPHKRYGNSLPADQLYMENALGITKLVNEMLRKGKRRIGFIGDYEHCQSFFERYSAFRCAMLLAGAPVEERFCLKVNRREEVEDALRALDGFPDLFICANDFIAVDAMQSLGKLGLAVPGDVLISGFDDAPESRIVTPPLTTVHIHTQSMAYSAVHLLLTRIKEPALDYRVAYTETELISRESTRI